MKQVNGQTAKQISEMLLELTSIALLSNNFESFSVCFHVPHLIETADNKKVLKTRDDLRSVFERVVEDYQRKGVTDLVRFCEVAEFRGETRVEATHITHMMSRNQRVADPFPAFSVLEFIDGRWQSISSQYAVDKDTTVGRAIRKSETDS